MTSSAAFPLEIPERFNAVVPFVDAPLAEGRGDRVAIAGVGEEVTYAALAERVNRAGNALRGLGVRREERVILLLPDCPEFAYAFFGAIKIGAVAVPINTFLKPADYAFILNDSRAGALVVHASLWERIAPIWSELRFLRVTLSVGGTVPGLLSFERELAAASPVLEPAETHRDDVALWLYTSGSTGFPKGALHLHHDFLHITDRFVAPVLGMTERDRTFSASKLFFAYGLGNGLYFPFRFGASTVLLPDRVEPERVFEVIDRYRPTFFFGVPTLYAAMLRVPDAHRRYDLSSLRICLSSGEPLPPALFHAYQERFGIELLDVVGSTEALHDFLANRPGAARPGSSGQVVPAFEAEIRDEEGRPLPDGEVGNLWVKGDATSPGYWNRHEQTKRTMVGEWLRTGDMYVRDADGYYTYCGRSDDMMKVSGLWVSPIEIENVLLEHPVVFEAAVVAHPDGDGLPKPKAYVVLKEPDRQSADLAEELRRHAAGRLPAYKVPRWVEFVSELPKTATGKIQRYRLRSGE